MYDHGGDIYLYSDKIIDFSSNINPLGIPESFKKRIIEHVDEVTQYPDYRYTLLKEKTAEYLQLKNPKHIVVGNGAVELIYKCMGAKRWNKVILMVPTFSEYKKAAKKYKLPVYEISTSTREVGEHGEYTLDFEKVLFQVEKDDLIVLCNPNNPTGMLLCKKEMEDFLLEVQKIGAYTMVDEAFIEFTNEYPKDSVLSDYLSIGNLFVIRAITKYFGMPGIRLGYGISSNETWIHAVQESLEPWNVNTLADLAGRVVFEDGEYIEKTRNWIKREIPNMYERLKEIQGITVYRSNANFHLLKIDKAGLDAYRFKELLAKEGYLIRTPEGFTTLSRQYFRLAVKTAEQNENLCRVIEKLLTK